MKKSGVLILMLLVVLFSSCKKDKKTISPPNYASEGYYQGIFSNPGIGMEYPFALVLESSGKATLARAATFYDAESFNEGTYTLSGQALTIEFPATSFSTPFVLKGNYDSSTGKVTGGEIIYDGNPASTQNFAMDRNTSGISSVKGYYQGTYGYLSDSTGQNWVYLLEDGGKLFMINGSSITDAISGSHALGNYQLNDHSFTGSYSYSGSATLYSLTGSKSGLRISGNWISGNAGFSGKYVITKKV